MTDQHIIAIGGGGFSTQSEPILDQYLLDQSAASKPNIGFIGTASGDSNIYLLKFYSRFSKLNCTPDHLPLFGNTPDIAQWMNKQDIIFVGGGNTKSMLATWLTWDMAEHLQAALKGGTLLAGISAGAICWFQTGITDSFAGKLAPLECLGFLGGSCCPHYSLELERKPMFEKLITQGDIPAGYAIDDGAAIHFVNGQPRQVISGSGQASAYFVFRNGETLETKKLMTTV